MQFLSAEYRCWRRDVWRVSDRYNFGLHETSQYLAPVLAWNIPSGWTVRLSPTFA